MTLGEDGGGLLPQSTVQGLDAVLADSERLIQTCHERGEVAIPGLDVSELIATHSRLARELVDIEL